MKNSIKYLLFSLIVLSFGEITTSCRGNSAKKAADIVKKYSGKVFKSSEKNTLKLRHGDDVIQCLDFQKVRCTECGGDGRTWRGTCDDCSGDGYRYKIKRKS